MDPGLNQMGRHLEVEENRMFNMRLVEKSLLFLFLF